MVDSGATISFMHQSLAQKHDLPLVPQRLSISLANGSTHTSENATRIVLQSSPDHFEVQSFQLITLGSYPLILGMDWLKKHNPHIDWLKKSIYLPCSNKCTYSSLPSVAQPTLPVTLPSSPAPTATPRPTPSATSNTPSPIYTEHNPQSTKTSKQNPQSTETPKHTISSLYDISIVSSATINQLLRQNQGVGYMLDVCRVESLHSVTAEIKPEITLPEKYAEYNDVFSKQEADKLPQHRCYDHSIPLVDGATVPFGPIYSLSQTELDVLHDYIKENLDKGFIRRSESPAGAPILFVKKKDGSLRLCVDYRGLNKVTVPNRCPLPLITETFDRLGKAKRFTQLDMRGAYNLLRITEGDEWKTAFRCRYGHFEYQVMPFGLMNAPASFQAFVNDVLREYLDDFVVVYLDDILIYSEDPEEHDRHVRKVLDKLREAKLSLKLEKCRFDQTEVNFLGFLVSTKGLSMDPEKIAAVKNWATPKSASDIQVFLGLANYFRRFVKDFSKLATPLTALLKKGVKFRWTASAEAAFQELKSRLCSGPILQHYDPTKSCVVETDASDYALGAVCSQFDDENRLRPIAYYSRKLLPAEKNYQIYDKELLAIVAAFKHWRHYLEFSANATTVLTDHRNLEYFATTRQLSRRQVRWSEVLSDFNFVIKYRPGTQNSAADALSRKDKPEGEGTTTRHLNKTEMTLLPTTHFLNSVKSLPLFPESPLIHENIRQSLPHDPHYGPIFQKVQAGAHQDSMYSIQEGLLLQDGLVCVPSDENTKRLILEECHDSPAAGHFGIAKTCELVSRTFTWPSMRKYIKRYVGGCETCQRNKSSNHKPYGLLQPLPVPDRPWSSVSVDFIAQLPPSMGYTAICVFVDRFTKMAHFSPTTDEVDAEGTVDLFIQRVFSAHGLPDDIVSDRGVTFTSQFTRSMFKALNIEQKLSTAYHPRTDGQTERLNSVLEQYLRCYVNYQQSDWSRFLPLAEFAYNNATHGTTKTTPFFANLGYHPKLSVKIPRVAKNHVPAADRIQEIKALHATMKFNIESALESHARDFDKKVSPQPNFKVNDLVWLSTQNLRTNRPTKKLDQKRIGPFKITEAVGTRSFRLDLPHTMKIHPIFHVHLLERYAPDTIPGRIQNPPPPVQVAGEDEYEVEAILDSKWIRNQLQYLVHWKGYPISSRSWEPALFLEHAQDLVQKYHKQHPNKPGPTASRSSAKRGRLS